MGGEDLLEERRSGARKADEERRRPPRRRPEVIPAARERVRPPPGEELRRDDITVPVHPPHPLPAVEPPRRGQERHLRPAPREGLERLPRRPDPVEHRSQRVPRPLPERARDVVPGERRLQEITRLRQRSLAAQQRREQDRAARVVRRGVAHAPGHRERLVESIEALQAAGDGPPRADVAGIGGQRLLRARERLVRPARLREELRQGDAGFGRVIVGGDGPPDEGDALVRPSDLPEGLPQTPEDGGMSRVLPQRLAVGPDRGVEATLPVLLLGLPQQLVDVRREDRRWPLGRDCPAPLLHAAALVLLPARARTGIVPTDASTWARWRHRGPHNIGRPDAVHCPPPPPRPAIGPVKPRGEKLG